ncbi:MAG: DNA repair protein RecN [Treponema sp.]|nr:DNA repair protein RecN [Treponema sp.]
MLEELSIKDFAIIEFENIEFSKGFTVLSGETGAGKSILIGALSFLLGGKAELSQIRAGCHEANVSGTFLLNETKDAEAFGWLSEHGIEAENARILIRRYIRDTGKSAAWIGGVPVTRADLSEFSSFLLDIHGQHEHQSLLKVPEHRKFLDARAGLVSEVESFSRLFASLVEKRRLLDKMNSSDAERLRTIDMYTYAVQEITEAKLLPCEDETLEAEESRLASYERLFSDIEEVKSSFDSGDGGVIPLLKKSMRASQNASSLDKTLSPLESRLESAFYEISDIFQEFDSYSQKLVYDPEHLSEVQERLSLIYTLKKKYASSQNAPLSEVFDYLENAKAALERLGANGTNKETLQSDIKTLERQVYVAAKSISEKRKASAATLSREVESILQNLGMKGARFSVNIVEKPGNDVEQKCGPYGMDTIEFLIGANVGSQLLPLAKIASGGELSRVMLALKTIFAENDPVETLIFDEIDTGIGGEIAVSLGRHLKNLAKSKQIFCITHLASIAVFADNQIRIKKAVSDGKTASSVRQVSGEERVQEIARMLSGDVESVESLEHARSMLEKAAVL